jgi:Acetyltransferase (GNAT) domain
MVLTGDRVTLRIAEQADLGTVFAIMTSPGVPEWWHVTTVGQCQQLLDEQCTNLIVERDGTPIGFLQLYEEEEPEYRHASVDVALHGDWLHQGLGTDAVRTAVAVTPAGTATSAPGRPCRAGPNLLPWSGGSGGTEPGGSTGRARRHRRPARPRARRRR